MLCFPSVSRQTNPAPLHCIACGLRVPYGRRTWVAVARCPLLVQYKSSCCCLYSPVSLPPSGDQPFQRPVKVLLECFQALGPRIWDKIEAHPVSLVAAIDTFIRGWFTADDAGAGAQLKSPVLRCGASVPAPTVELALRLLKVVQHSSGALAWTWRSDGCEGQAAPVELSNVARSGGHWSQLVEAVENGLLQRSAQGEGDRRRPCTRSCLAPLDSSLTPAVPPQVLLQMLAPCAA